jgi:hypothetical protein
MTEPAGGLLSRPKLNAASSPCRGDPQFSAEKQSADYDA